MAAARKTTNTTRATSTAKADDTKADDTKVEDTKASTATQADDVKTDAKGDDTPVGATKESEAAKSDDEGTNAEDLKSFVEDDRSTQEKVDDSEVTNVVPANYDPVVNADHAQASRAAQARVEDTKKAVRLQVRQFDTSEFGGDVLDALDSKKSKSDDKDGDKK